MRLRPIVTPAIIVMGTLAAQIAIGADAPAADGAYTAAQAEAGTAVYAENCASCHGNALEGGAGPALKGDAFKELAAAQGLTGATLLRVVSDTMPQSSPASLKDEEYAGVVAFLLRENGYAAGPQPLSATSARAAALKLGN